MGAKLIIDSNAICHTEFHAMGNLKFDTQNTGVIFGFMIQIQTLARYFNSGDFIFCWDSRKSKRKERHPWYKKKDTEKKTQEEIDAMKAGFRQFAIIRNEILPKLGFNNNFIATGYESDDLMANIVRNCAGHKVMVTNDADMYQTLDHCNIYLLRKKKIFTAKDFVKEYGIQPKDWVRVKQIAGCTSDRVPGIEGVGEKTAIKFITNNINPGKKRNAILAKAGQDIIERNKWLVKLPLEGCPVPALRPNTPSLQGFVEVCAEYGMESLLQPANMGVWNHIIKMK